MTQENAQKVQYQHWKDFMQKAEVLSSPAAIQGFLTGLLACGHRLDHQRLIELMAHFLDTPDIVENDVFKPAIEALYDLTLKSMNDDSFTFDVLLPDDDSPMIDRLEALAAWADSFLYGFGQIADEKQDKLSEASRELLDDFTQIAQVDIDSEDQQDEASFTELYEYSRLGALSLFYECNEQPAEAAQAGSHSIH